VLCPASRIGRDRSQIIDMAVISRTPRDRPHAAWGWECRAADREGLPGFLTRACARVRKRYQDQAIDFLASRPKKQVTTGEEGESATILGISGAPERWADTCGFTVRSLQESTAREPRPDPIPRRGPADSGSPCLPDATLGVSTTRTLSSGQAASDSHLSPTERTKVRWGWCDLAHLNILIAFRSGYFIL